MYYPQEHSITAGGYINASGAIDRVYSVIRNCTSRCADLSPGLLNTAGSIERARRRLLDTARQPFTMNNHLVEILFHSRRGNVCLEPPGSRRCCAIICGRLFFRWTSNPKSLQDGQHS